MQNFSLQANDFSSNARLPAGLQVVTVSGANHLAVELTGASTHELPRRAQHAFQITQQAEASADQRTPVCLHEVDCVSSAAATTPSCRSSFLCNALLLCCFVASSCLIWLDLHTITSIWIGRAVPRTCCLTLALQQPLLQPPHHLLQVVASSCWIWLDLHCHAPGACPWFCGHCCACHGCWSARRGS